MLFSNLESIRDQLFRELRSTPHVRRIKLSPNFYHELSEVIDMVHCDNSYGLDIIEDPSVETYALEF